MAWAQKLLKHIIDDSRPELLRAINLYEFQIGIFRYGEQRRRARKYAALKLMEYVEKSRKLAPREQISELLRDEDYASVFRVALSGGWRGLRRLGRNSAFDDGTQKRIERSLLAAQVVDFLYRFKATKKRKFPSLALAIAIVRKGADEKERRVYGGHQFAKTVAKERWREFDDLAIFVYLLRFHKHELAPKRVGAKDFAATLLAQLRDKTAILQFVADYNAVVAELKNKKIHRYEPLEIAGSKDFAPDLKVQLMESAVEDAIDRYRSALD